MPAVLNVPGVYIEEIQPDVHPIAGVSTSDTAFIDYFARGPMKRPMRVSSYVEFTRAFGPLHAKSQGSYAIAQFFANGGSVAWVVRVGEGGTNSSLTLQNTGTDAAHTKTDALTITASDAGTWGDSLTVEINTDTNPKATTPPTLFNLIVREVAPGSDSQTVQSETFRNLSMDATDPQYVLTVINQTSKLIGATRPVVNTDAKNLLPDNTADGANPEHLGSGADPTAATEATIEAGISALDQIAPAVVSLMCLPGAPDLGAADFIKAIGMATTYCETHRIFLLIDIPGQSGPQTASDMVTWHNDAAKMPAASKNSAVYFPRLNVPDPLAGGQLKSIPASGTIAGIVGRTDSARGVWKAPAGTDASIRGALLATQVNDSDNGLLNVQGVNVLRAFPIYGSVVWGARTTQGADAKADPWKYIPVRRTALYLEESMYQGLKWVTFEPNDFPLWSQIRLNVGAFLNGLFRQGAFAGLTPRDAYFVKCDKDTTTQADVDRGVVNILVGFAPLKPAEFVVLQIQQMAGQGAG